MEAAPGKAHASGAVGPHPSAWQMPGARSPGGFPGGELDQVPGRSPGHGPGVPWARSGARPRGARSRAGSRGALGALPGRSGEAPGRAHRGEVPVRGGSRVVVSCVRLATRSRERPGPSTGNPSPVRGAPCQTAPWLDPGPEKRIPPGGRGPAWFAPGGPPASPGGRTPRGMGVRVLHRIGPEERATDRSGRSVRRRCRRPAPASSRRSGWWRSDRTPRAVRRWLPPLPHGPLPRSRTAPAFP